MRKKFLNAISHLSVLHTWWMLAGILLLTIFLGYRAGTLQMRTGFDNLLPGDNPRTNEYNRIIDEFQNESYIILLARGAEERLRLDMDRVEYWLKQGAQVSARVKSLIKAYRKDVGAVDAEAEEAVA